MLIEPATFLRQVNHDYLQAGGRFVIREFHDRAELLALAEPVIFNCTGLGAKALFDDQELIPIKGQLLYLPPDPAVDYLTIGGGDGVLYMFSRSDALVLGGTWETDDWSRHAEPAETQRILTEHQKLFSNFG